MTRKVSIVLPSIIPVRLPDKAGLAAAARSVAPLRAARTLADWVGDAPIDIAEGWRSPRAQLDVGRSLGLLSADSGLTPEVTGRMHWLYEVAFHAGYVHTDNDQTMHRNHDLADHAERTDKEILADWTGAIGALIAHGLEEALPPDVNPAPLDFGGIGNFPLLRLLELHGSTSVATLSATVAAGATEGMTPSSGRQQWAAWTAKHGDPTAAFLRLAAELGVITLDGDTAELTPLGTWIMIESLKGAQTEQLPPPAELTARQVILCRLGMSETAFGKELDAWLAAREPATAVTGLLTAAADAGDDGSSVNLTVGVRIAADVPGDTEAAWRAALELPMIRPYAAAELNRRAGRDFHDDPLPGLEPHDCDAAVMASHAIIAAYQGSKDTGELAAAVREAASRSSEASLFETMRRSRHRVAEQALAIIGKEHPDKKTAKAARTALYKAASAR